MRFGSLALLEQAWARDFCWGHSARARRRASMALLYLEDFCSAIEQLPQDMKQSFSRMRTLDFKAQNALDALDRKAMQCFSNGASSGLAAAGGRRGGGEQQRAAKQTIASPCSSAPRTPCSAP
eukprot:m.119763 g.119763  ORF g.119763 m.119763 type:complete len:123 (+) comp9563_c1_seq3:3324-3692(+)